MPANKYMDKTNMKTDNNNNGSFVKKELFTGLVSFLTALRV